MNKTLKYILSVLLVVCPALLFGQKQLLKSALKSSKLFKVEAKNLTKEGVENANKAMMKNAFKTGSEEIGKDYMQKATAKQIIRRAYRLNFLKEIEEKGLGSIMRYGMVNARKEIAHTEKSAVKELAEKSARNVNYKGRIRTYAEELSRYASKTATRIIVSPKNQYISKSQYLKWLEKNAGKIKKTGVKDAKVLRDNMYAVMGKNGKYAKNTLKNGNQAHHIVGNKTPIAASKLKQYGIDINDPINGIFLPSSGRSGLRGVVHRGGHSEDYYDYIERMFSQCKSKKDCYEVLDKLKSDLYKGKIKLYREGTNKVNKTFKTVA